MSQRLKYSVIKLSSEDPEFPGAELLAHSSQTKGWQSARFCDFPQEIGLGFDNVVHLRQVQFLSHQSKIATKVELYTALPNSDTSAATYENAHFKRLGYLSLDSNERSNFQARELKSVYVDVTTQFVKVLFHKCHINKYNLVNQVALIALNCLGEVVGPDLALGPPDTVPKRSPSAPSAPREISNQLVDEMKFDPYTLDRMKSVAAAKKRAIELEDYDEAKRCKEMLQKLRTMGQALKELEHKKQQAVMNEEYDIAKSLKIEIDRIHGSISEGAETRFEKRKAPHRPASLERNHNRPEAFLTKESEFPAKESRAPKIGNGPGVGAPSNFAMENGHNHMPERSEVKHSQELWNRKEANMRPEPLAPDEASEEDMRTPSGVESSIMEQPIYSSQPSPMSEFPPDAGENTEWNTDALKGVPNADTLPEPEHVNVSFLKEVQPLNAFFGDIIVRCLYSKSWNLREAAFAKLDLDMNTNNDPISGEKLRCLMVILKRAGTDRIAQVYF